MKAIKKTLATAVLAAATIPAANAVEVSGNVALTTDYKFRGISQTDSGPAIQGGFDLAWDNGFYVGTWASNVDFAGSLELDYYVGFSGSISEEVSFDLGFLYYDYPHDDDGISDDYEEFYASLSFAGATLGVAYSDDYYAESDEFMYYYVDYELPLSDDYTLGFHYGYNDFDTDVFLGNDDHYADWSVSLSTSAFGLDFSLAYVDTDLDDDADCFGDEKLCEASAVFTISKSM